MILSTSGVVGVSSSKAGRTKTTLIPYGKHPGKVIMHRREKFIHYTLTPLKCIYDMISCGGGGRNVILYESIYFLIA